MFLYILAELIYIRTKVLSRGAVHSHKDITLCSIVSVFALGLYSALIKQSFRIKQVNLSHLEEKPSYSVKLSTTTTFTFIKSWLLTRTADKIL